VTAARRILARGRVRRFGRKAFERLLSATLVLWASATVTFFALRLTPGDPVRAVLGGPTANPTPETIAHAIKEFGLDQPLYVQYLLHLARLAQGDLGVSFSQHRPVLDVIAEQVGPTLILTVSAVAVAWGLATASALATARRHPLISGIGTTVETVLATIPHFWLALMLLAVFAFGLRWFPPQSGSTLSGLVLPTLALALPLAGFLGQVTRESLDLALEQPFVLTARTRGLSDWSVRWRHALRHAAAPGISLSAWAIGALIGNAVLVEVIFSRPGLGRVLYEAVTVQDMPLTIGVTLVVTLIYIVSSLLVDLLQAALNPRLNERRK